MTSTLSIVSYKMKNYYRADKIFKDLPNEVKQKIYSLTEGKLVYFPRNHTKRSSIDRDKVLIQYARGKRSYNQIGGQLGVSKVRICQIVNQEKERFSRERVEHWQSRGLSLREIAKLYKKSHERVRQIIE